MAIVAILPLFGGSRDDSDDFEERMKNHKKSTKVDFFIQTPLKKTLKIKQKKKSIVLKFGIED